MQTSRPDVTHSKEYKKRINSADWKKLRKQLIERCGCICDRCKKKSDGLDLHHKNYDRLGKELLSDLEILCLGCHEIADRERKNRTEDNRDHSQYLNARNTYYIKKYGESNLGHQTPIDDDIFDEWLKEKREEENRS